MTGKPLPNVYDDNMKDDDLNGDLTGGKLNDCTVRMTIDSSQMADLLDDLVTSMEDDETIFDDVVDKFKNDVAAALRTLCRGDANSISVNRTLRDGVNNRRKLVVRFTATLTEVYDSEYDSEETDDFQ